MVEVRGFQALRFDASKTGALDIVLTPPYDVIDEKERHRLAALNPYNMTHLILPESRGAETPYENAARLFRQWIAEGVLRPDPEPSLYLLKQRFTDSCGDAFERKAFFALLKLPDQGEQFILGHEHTFDKPVEDRIALMRAVRADLEPIFVMYTDSDNNLANQLFQPMGEQPPLFSASTSDNVTQELWRTPCPDYLGGHFENQTLYIADGHHRFKTASMYRDECRKQQGGTRAPARHDYIMAGFIAFEEPGLKIYAAHRAVSEPFPFNFEECMGRLTKYFDCRELPPDASDKDLDGVEAVCAFIMRTRGRGTWLLCLKEEKRLELLGDDRGEAWRALDVAVLHRGVLSRLLGVGDDVYLIYEKDAGVAATLVDSGRAALAFLLRPTRPEQVRACAEAFEPMPQKSTYFFPKLPSGAVMYSLE
ncbi:MAG TPA: DUF1015 domain-containing protein [Candidatus Hydrogenedentes bacterium]|mgnify:CR=1 FL=1|nr:DUF1015 domain-containing protein [Candidatus Hydrogenedentota bacterium]